MVHLREIRKEKGKTLKDIAEATGYTIGYLSQIERDLKEPTLEALRKIAFALELNITDLLVNPEREKREDDKTAASFVVRKESRQNVYIDPLDLTYQLLTKPAVKDDGHQKMKAMVSKMEPNSLGTGAMVKHQTEEFVLVLDGTMICIVEDEEIELQEGDSMVIPKGRMHAFENRSDKTVEVLMVTH